LAIGRTGVNTVFASGSTADFTGVTVLGITLSGSTFAGTSTFSGPVVVNTGQSVTLNGNTTLTMGTGTFSSSGNITTSGNISTTGTGTITSAGLLTASNGLTVSAGLLTAAAGLTVSSGIVTLPVGSVAAPSLTFAGHTGDGLYWNASGASMAITSGGADRLVTYHLKTPITNSTVTSIIRVAGLGTTPRAGVCVTWMLEATDGTNHQTMMGTSWLAAQQTAGTASGNVAYTESAVMGSGTLTAAWSVDAATAGQVDLRVTPVSSLTTTLIQLAMSVTAVNAVANVISFL
jgi:hypothetical protein